MFTDWQNPSEIPAVRVLNVTLRGPLTLGHVLLLDDLQSPVVRGESFDIGQLMVAVLVCSQSHEESRRDVRKWWMPHYAKWMGYRCGLLDFTAEAERFSQWFTDQCGGPRIDDGDEKQSKRMRPQSAPWFMSKLAMAVGELGLSVEEASAMPMKRLNQLVSALAEVRGDVKFITESTARALAEVEQWEKEAAKGVAA